MDLTSKNKASIDKMDYESLLYRWRNAPVGDPWFQGETGDYWKQRMTELRNVNPAGHVQASKNIGWRQNESEVDK